MSGFAYRVRDPAGNLVRGRAEAETEQALVEQLRSQGLLVLHVVRERSLRRFLRQVGVKLPVGSRVAAGDLAGFCRHFAVMLQAGIPAVAALNAIRRQTANRRLQQALARVTAAVEGGDSLGEAFQRHGQCCSQLVLHGITAGEAGGILEAVLYQLADQLEREEVMRQKVQTAMIYPTLVVMVAVGVIGVLLGWVLPRFVSVYEDLGVELPFLTRMLMAVRDHLAAYGWVSILAAGTGALALWRWLRTAQGALAWDRFKLKIPIFGVILARQSLVRFARTLGGLLASGIPILDALGAAEHTAGNRAIAAAVRDTSEQIRYGVALVVPLRRSGVFPPVALEMVSAGEEAGRLPEMLGKVADHYDQELQRSAERLTATLEPMIIVCLGLVVGVVVLSLVLPVFGLWGTLGTL